MTNVLEIAGGVFLGSVVAALGLTYVGELVKKNIKSELQNHHTISAVLVDDDYRNDFFFRRIA